MKTEVHPHTVGKVKVFKGDRELNVASVEFVDGRPKFVNALDCDWILNTYKFDTLRIEIETREGKETKT